MHKRIGVRTLLHSILCIAAVAMSQEVSAASGTIPLPRPRPQVIVVDLSKPLNCLARAVYEEARGESFEGQQMVSHIVRYRALFDSPGFGGPGICGVVNAKGQFDGIKGAVWSPKDDNAWYMALIAAHSVLVGRFVPKGELRFATYYLEPATASLGGRCWFERNLKPIAWVGVHLFYREPLSYEKLSPSPECSQHIASR